jgi:hypothetical protein
MCDGSAANLEGTVRRAGSRLRVSGQLAGAETGALIWANMFKGKMSDVFDLQDRIAENIQRGLAVSCLTRSPDISTQHHSRPEALEPRICRLAMELEYAESGYFQMQKRGTPSARKWGRRSKPYTAQFAERRLS